jgi:hypothetical protein
VITFIAAGGITLAAAGAAPEVAPQDETSCVLETLAPSARQSLVDALAIGERPPAQAAFQENAAPIREAMQACNAKFAWPEAERTIVAKAFEYDLRLEASIKRLQANGLSLEAASQMFESLPASMHEAIFGLRDMTPEEMQLLQAAFEGLVKNLGGPDGNALSEYITARAGYGHYAHELLSR